MRVVFRVNFHTEPGQSLWLRYAIVLGSGVAKVEQVVPMRWLNGSQWEIGVDLEGSGALRVEYAYQLRQEGNGVELDEWNGPRVLELDFAKHDLVLRRDTWCSAGTVDHAFETKGFDAILPKRGPFAKALVPKGANHGFCLGMAAVPEGMVPCVLGGVREIGDWDWTKAVPMTEVAANRWEANFYLPSDWRIEYKYGLCDVKSGRVVSLEVGENRSLEPRALAQNQWTAVSDEGYRRDGAGLYRGAGVAIPVFSLRSENSLGVGEFADLKPLADWAAQTGLKLIQILPINDTTSSHDWTDSYPYSAISVDALHPIYLRLDDLDHAMPADFAKELKEARAKLNALSQVDYEGVMAVKSRLLKRVFEKHAKTITVSAGFKNFLKENRHWVLPYAVFCVKRDHFGTADFSRWGEWSVYDAKKVDALCAESHAEWSQVSYHIWLQYELDRQLSDAVAHLHAKGIVLKGDLPIGIDRQSVDAWSAPHLFKMDAQAGAPPDAFAIKGQNWGFPTYNWEVMRRDGYAWWRSRFERLSRYFDAYRIDHILGFFRIWQIPYEQVEGIMGWFDPAMPVHVDEIRWRGIAFDYERYCRPYIREHFLWEKFGDQVGAAKEAYLDDCGYGVYRLKDHVSTQRKIVDHFAAIKDGDEGARQRLRQGLMDCVSEVLLLEVPGSHGTQFHPRCSMQMTRSYQELDADTKRRIEDLYVDYFYRRQEGFWQARGYEKLPAMRKASRMLLCGEDLGMVPACVPGVMRELGILSLEIQRMPRSSDVEFSHPAWAPYLSVVSPSTHDMPTLRGWWRENSHVSGQFAWKMLGVAFPPMDLPGDLAARIIDQHLHSPGMWAIFPLQDLLGMDEQLRNADIDIERINVPAIMPYYWRYRMHLGLEGLAKAGDFNKRLREMVENSGR